MMILDIGGSLGSLPPSTQAAAADIGLSLLLVGRLGFNIVVEPALIAVELRGLLGNIHYRWEHAEDWTPRERGVAVHAETVRIHGFVDGNGRSTRLLADLVFLAAQDAEAIAETYDWRIDKKEYIALLRGYDLSRRPRPLAEFVLVRRLDETEKW
ncbi:Fic family protein [Streptomyces sp. MS2A]|nr:Fic family protein [Streptomyces sp. MS2A]